MHNLEHVSCEQKLFEHVCSTTLQLIYEVHCCTLFIALLLGLEGSIPDAPAAPINGGTKSGSDKPKVSLDIVTTGY